MISKEDFPIYKVLLGFEGLLIQDQHGQSCYYIIILMQHNINFTLQCLFVRRRRAVRLTASPFSENYSNTVCKYLVGPLVPEIGHSKCLNLNRTTKT
jgi:hypothetical protein